MVLQGNTLCLWLVDIRSHASTHKSLALYSQQDTMTSAATTIQAAFRGHSVRQGLNWKLPSGRTLRSTAREGLHQRPRISGAGASESSQYSTARDTVVPNEGNSTISDINTSYSSVRSNVQSPTHSSRSLKVMFFEFMVVVIYSQDARKSIESYHDCKQKVSST